jgi:hypothetical protein
VLTKKANRSNEKLYRSCEKPYTGHWWIGNVYAKSRQEAKPELLKMVMSMTPDGTKIVKIAEGSVEVNIISEEDWDGSL